MDKMTNEPIMLKLKSEEDLNEKIIKEKGNTKCIFYSDDVCRKGDKTRDCLNCARVEYRSLYSLNWDNQERLQEELKQKEQECERLKSYLTELSKIIDCKNGTILTFKQQLDALKEELENFKDDCKGCTTCIEAQNNERIYSQSSNKYKQALQEIKKMCKQKLPVGLSVPSCYESFEAFTGYILQKCEDVL